MPAEKKEIEQDAFKRYVQILIPEDRKQLLLPIEHIYKHLAVLKKLEDEVRDRYTKDDPALFQNALSDDEVGLLFLYDYLDKAARVGNMPLIQWLMAPERGRQRVKPTIDTLCVAAASGNLELVQWLMAPERGKQCVNPDVDTLTDAAGSGNLELVQWLMALERGTQRVSPNLDTLRAAKKSGNLELEQWLMARERDDQRVSYDQWSSMSVTWSEKKETQKSHITPLHKLEHWSLLKVMAPPAGATAAQTNAWVNKTKRTLRDHIQAVIPVHRRSLLLPEQDIYKNFLALSKLTKDIQDQYAVDEPALFQCALSKNEMMQVSLQDCLWKAARVDNLPLVKWLMAPERDKHRVKASPKLISEIKRGSLGETVQLWFEQTLQLKNPPSDGGLSMSTVLSAAVKTGSPIHVVKQQTVADSSQKTKRDPPNHQARRNNFS